LRSPVKARGVLERTFSTDALAECGANGRRRHSAFLGGEDRLRPGQELAGAYPDGTARIKQHPQRDIALHGVQDGLTTVGLDLERMLTCWNLLRLFPNRQYRFVSKEYNCASMAAALLMVGGAGFYSEMATGKKPDLGTLWTTPNDVRDWALEIQQGIDMARRTRNAILQPVFAGDAGPMERAPDGQTEIMDVATWTRLSCVKGTWSTGLARRKDQVKRIDEQLRDYHALGAWNWRDLPQCEKKIRLLGTMLREVSSHLMAKGTSDRRDAVLQLGAQILARYDIISVMYSATFGNVQVLLDIENQTGVKAPE
jgi:hypothetical protein